MTVGQAGPFDFGVVDGRADDVVRAGSLAVVTFGERDDETGVVGGAWFGVVSPGEVDDGDCTDAETPVGEAGVAVWVDDELQAARAAARHSAR